jgi:isopentenyl diphosphate isomerase/L-lactate dehydrogenase-like FMN-dependent dehydrogenase
MAFQNKLESPENMAERKAQHLDICLDKNKPVETGPSYFDQISFPHFSLPEQDARELTLKQEFCDYECDLPVFISSMTGGSAEGFAANKTLARLAQECKIPVGTGSMRIVFRKEEVLEHFMLKKNRSRCSNFWKSWWYANP